MIGELARLLPEKEELEFTTDPDRILELAPGHGKESSRPPVKAALSSGTREEVAVALAREVSALQDQDRKRLEKYEQAGEKYLEQFRGRGIAELDLPRAHREAVSLAEKLLPEDPIGLKREDRERESK